MIDHAALDRAVRRNRLLLALARKFGVETWDTFREIGTFRPCVTEFYHEERANV